MCHSSPSNNPSIPVCGTSELLSMRRGEDRGRACLDLVGTDVTSQPSFRNLTSRFSSYHILPALSKNVHNQNLTPQPKTDDSSNRTPRLRPRFGSIPTSALRFMRFTNREKGYAIIRLGTPEKNIPDEAVDDPWRIQTCIYGTYSQLLLEHTGNYLCLPTI